MLDLIDECGEELSQYGYETTEVGRFGITSSKLFVDSVGKSRKLGFDKGHYFIVNAPLLSTLMPEHRPFLETVLAERISFILKENKIKKSSKLLFVGIGNPAIMADSLGPKVVEKIAIKPFKKNNRILKMIPNTFSNTGINAYDMIRVMVEAFDVSAVFLFDSLATNSLARLGCSIQMNDAGLTPGSAMNNFGMPINKSTVNVSCFSVGVPMMISSKDLGGKVEVVLAEKDVEEKVEFLSDLIAGVFDVLL